MAARRWTTGFLAVAWLATVGHAALTWPIGRVAVLFGGGVAIAFVAEATVIRLGLLEHHTGPRLAGVPLAILAAWPAVVYVWYRIALLGFDPGVAAVVGGALATLSDVVTDPRGVEAGLWSYPPASISTPRYRGVPWWNFVGWLLVVWATATLPSLLGV